MKHKRRMYLNLIQDPFECYTGHEGELEEILKPFLHTSHREDSKINVDQQIYISSAWQDKNYVRAVKVCEGSKIYSTSEDDLFVE